MSNGDTENNTMDLTMNTKENNNNNSENKKTDKENNKQIDDLHLHDTLGGEKDAENNQNNVTDDTDVFLKPRQDSMSLYTNFMPRLSSATEMSIANFFNMETGNLNNSNNNKDNTSSTGTTTNTTSTSNSNNTKSGNKAPMDVNSVNRGYSIVNNNSQSSLYNVKSRRQSVSHSGSVGLGGGNNNSNTNSNSTQEYNGTRRQSEQLEPFVAPMKFKTPNFGSSATSITNNTSNSKIKRSNSVTPGPTNIMSSKSKDQMGGGQQPTGTGNTKQNNNTTASSSVGATGIQNTDSNANNSPSLPPQLADLPSLRSDSISSILGAAALMNQPLQPPSKRNSFFIPTDSHTQLTQLQQQQQNQQQNQSSDQKTMKPPSTTAPVYHNKQQGLNQGQGQTQQQNQQFQNLMNNNSLSNFYSEGTPGAQNAGTDNIDFDIFNLNTSRKSSFRFGDDFDLSAFRRRDSSVRGTLDLPPLPGSSVGNRLRSSSRTFSQILNNPQLTVHPGTTTTSGSNMNQQHLGTDGADHSNSNNSNNNGSGSGAHSTHKNNNHNDHKSSQYSNFLKNHENAISDYDDDEDLDLHALPKNSGSHQLGGQNTSHSHQGTMDSRMILRRKSNLKDTSLTPIPLTTPPLTSFSHQLNQHHTQNQHSTHSNNGNSHVSHHITDPLGSLDVDSQIGGSPSIDFDMDGNIIGTHDFEPPTDLETVPKQSTSKSSSSKKSSSSSSSSSSSKKDKTKKSRKRKSSSSTEHGKEPEESKPKKRKSSKKSSSSKSSSTSESTETTSKKSSSSTSGSTNSSSTSSSSSKSKKSKVKKETKPKSTRRTKKSTTSTDGETPSTKSTSSSTTSSGTKKKKSSKSSTSTKKPSQKKSRASASAAAARAAESLMSQPIVVENPMKAKDGSNDSDGPVLGATRVDQLMLILQARQKGYTSALETTSDGKIKIENAPEIIPPAIELVGGVDKPKTHDLLLNPPPAVEQKLPTPQEVSAQSVPTTETNAKAGKKGKVSTSAGSNGKSVSVKVNSTSPKPSGKSVADGPVTVDGADGTASQSGSSEATPTPSGRRKLHICQYCNKQFTQSTHLEVHVRSHIGLKPYECSYCGKTFTQGGNLRTHIRLHTGEQPFQCKVCGKKFSRKGNLQAHALTHEDFRPFRCILDGCDKSFTQLGNLKSHQNKFHLETLNVLTLKLAKNDFDLNNEEERKLLEYLSSLYKNSNKGIKGRGKNSASLKSKDGLEAVSFPTGEQASVDPLPDAAK